MPSAHSAPCRGNAWPLWSSVSARDRNRSCFLPCRQPCTNRSICRAPSLGAVTFSSGGAALSTSSLAVGSHSITATFAGSSTFAASTSSAVTITVRRSLPRPVARPTPARHSSSALPRLLRHSDFYSASFDSALLHPGQRRGLVEFTWSFA